MDRFPITEDPFEAPMRLEADITDLECVQGEVPEHLDGSYYRVVVDRHYPSFIPNDLALFNSDGMVMSFTFRSGRVDFKSRYVRTPRFVAEEKAGRSLFGAYRNAFTDDPTVAGVRRGLANTNVFFHGGRLYASKEDSPPILIDPVTLETLGEYQFEGAMTSETSTAHPKVDPRTGEMVFFGYAATGEATPDIAYYEADANGSIIHETWIRAPYSCMIHDFAVTQNFVVFPIVPLRSSTEWLREGNPQFFWDPNEDVYLGVLPRKGTARQLRWFRGSNRFASHIMGAYDDGRRIYLDTPVAETNYFPWFPDITGATYDPERSKTRLSRWTIDMSDGSDGFTEERLMSAAGEFPRMDDRYETLRYHWGVMAVNDLPGQQKSSHGFRWVGTIDHASATTRFYDPGENSTVGEPIFVPANETAREGEGYVFVVVARRDRMYSELVILDAAHVDRPPVATLRMPMRIKSGLHGNWVSSDELAGRTA
ncbi:carotenoid oxygenase family protein [Gordonia jacobaea]|uniref:carotenoid oxygenase family protein n=1 Tax=Gordonia jacobaea TaxID=122202 RepID=UPI003D718B78